MTDITANTTRDAIVDHLDSLDADFAIEWNCPQDSIRVELPNSKLLIYRHQPSDGADIAGLWAWRETENEDGNQSSSGLDSFEELTKLVVPRDTLIGWLVSGDSRVYEERENFAMVSLSETGVDICEAHGLRVDVDAYDCAYCPDHVCAD